MANESFPYQQEKLFPELPQPTFNTAAAAAHIAEHAPLDPYAAQEARAAGVVDGRDGEDLRREQTGLGQLALNVRKFDEDSDTELHEGKTGLDRSGDPTKQYWKKSYETNPERQRYLAERVRALRNRQ